MSSSIIRSFVVVLTALSYATAQVPLGVQMVPNPEMGNSPSSSPAPSPSPSGSYPGNSYPSNAYPSDSYPPSYSSASYPPSYSSNSYPPSYPSNSYQSVSALPIETGSPTLPAPPSYYTPPPAQSSVYNAMPYSSFTGGGYSQMDCGYGYKKGYDGKCQPEDWVCFFRGPENRLTGYCGTCADRVCFFQWTSSGWGCYQTTIIINDPQYVYPHLNRCWPTPDLLFQSILPTSSHSDRHRPLRRDQGPHRHLHPGTSQGR